MIPPFTAVGSEELRHIPFSNTGPFATDQTTSERGPRTVSERLRANTRFVSDIATTATTTTSHRTTMDEVMRMMERMQLQQLQMHEQMQEIFQKVQSAQRRDGLKNI